MRILTRQSACACARKMSKIRLQLEPKKCTEWFVAAAKGDYQELAKLAHSEPRLVKLKVSRNSFEIYSK